jgi:hypothetical protein
MKVQHIHTYAAHVIKPPNTVWKRGKEGGKWKYNRGDELAKATLCVYMELPQ